MNSEGHGPIYVNRTHKMKRYVVVDAAPFLIRDIHIIIIHKPLRVRSNWSNAFIYYIFFSLFLFIYLNESVSSRCIQLFLFIVRNSDAYMWVECAPQKMQWQNRFMSITNGFLRVASHNFFFFRIERTILISRSTKTEVN